MTSGATTPERRWIAWLRTAPDARAALRVFCPQYFHFSYRQVVAFSALFKQVDPLDRESLAMLGDVLHEELGRGDPERVHSKLFERFAVNVGLDAEQLRLDRAHVLPGVLAYADELERAFAHGSRAEALATYVFLESSAVDTYEPLVEALEAVGFDSDAVEFFRLHAGVEPEHAAAADAMLRRHELSPDDVAVRSQTDKLTSLWHGFWRELDESCRRAVAR
jgi:pyrroloquinoline quinone (PQQ) biosynthesis protein C